MLEPGLLTLKLAPGQAVTEEKLVTNWIYCFPMILQAAW